MSPFSHGKYRYLGLVIILPALFFSFFVISYAATTTGIDTRIASIVTNIETREQKLNLSGADRLDYYQTLSAILRKVVDAIDTKLAALSPTQTSPVVPTPVIGVPVSTDGTTIPSATQIVDANRSVWTVTNGVISKDGRLAGYSNAVTKLVYKNGLIYQQNTAGNWWSWNGTTWVSTSNPLGTSTPTPVNPTPVNPVNPTPVNPVPVSNLGPDQVVPFFTAGKTKIGTNFWQIGWDGPTKYFTTNVNWATTTNPWDPKFLDDLAPYSFLRFMDFVPVNNSLARDWSSRTKKTDNHYNTEGVAFEWQIDLCNRLMKDCWFTIPHLATDDYVQQLALLIKNSLNPQLKAYIEYSNELWNGYFEQSKYAVQQAGALGLPVTSQGDIQKAAAFTLYRSFQIFKIFRDVYGTDMQNRVIRVIAGFGVWLTPYEEAFTNIQKSTRWNPSRETADLLAIAPYVGHDLSGDSPNIQSLFHAKIDETVNSQLVNGTAIAKRLGIPLGTYEAGQHLTQSADVWSRNPAIYTEYTYMINQMAPYLVTYSHYNQSSNFNGGGAWGAKESQNQPLSQAHKYRAIVDWVARNPGSNTPLGNISSTPTPVTPKPIVPTPVTPTPTVTTPPATTVSVSPDGTTIPSATQIVDANRSVWTVTNGVISKDGRLAGYSNAVTKLVYKNGLIYQQNTAGNWWSWNGTTWVSTSNPLGTSTPTPVNPTPVTPNLTRGSCSVSSSTTLSNPNQGTLCSVGNISGFMEMNNSYMWACTGTDNVAVSCTANKTPTTTLPNNGGVTPSPGGNMAGMTYIDTSKIPADGPASQTFDIATVGAGGYGTIDPGFRVGAFRNVCQFSHMNFDDPIVYPGQQGKAHLHTFWGNSDLNYQTTPSNITQYGGGTCRGGTANRSGYWVPAMIDANGVPQKPAFINVYYKSGYGGVPYDQIKTFPAGLVIIAGNQNSSNGSDNVYYRCNNDYNTQSQLLLNNCAGPYMDMTVIFPQCWNGKDLDSPDHKSHMAFPIPGIGCPASHPVAVPEITYGIFYKVEGTTTNGWRLSSDKAGAPAGSSGHGDWMHGWNQEIMDAWVKNIVTAGLSGGSHIIGDGRVMTCNFAGCY